MKTRTFLLISLLILSCQTNNKFEKKYSNAISTTTDEIFFYQGVYNDKMTNLNLMAKNSSEITPNRTISFQSLFYLNDIRRLISNDLSKLLQNSNNLNSIEIMCNREMYVHYWNESKSYSFKKTSQSAKIESINIEKEGFDRFDDIKNEMLIGTHIDSVFNELKKVRYVHNESTYLISRYTYNDDKISHSEFSIW